MMRITFEASRRSSYLTTSTSGLIAFIDSSAESTFGTPTRSVVWMTCRWRFDTSTTSSSTSPRVPTPAAARDSAVGEPGGPAAGGGEVRRRRRAEAAGAEEQDLRVEELLLPGLADLRQEEVA